MRTYIELTAEQMEPLPDHFTRPDVRYSPNLVRYLLDRSIRLPQRKRQGRERKTNSMACLAKPLLSRYTECIKGVLDEAAIPARRVDTAE